MLSCIRDTRRSPPLHQQAHQAAPGGTEPLRSGQEANRVDGHSGSTTPRRLVRHSALRRSRCVRLVLRIRLGPRSQARESRTRHRLRAEGRSGVARPAHGRGRGLHAVGGRGLGAADHSRTPARHPLRRRRTGVQPAPAGRTSDPRRTGPLPSPPRRRQAPGGLHPPAVHRSCEGSGRRRSGPLHERAGGCLDVAQGRCTGSCGGAPRQGSHRRGRDRRRQPGRPRQRHRSLPVRCVSRIRRYHRRRGSRCRPDPRPDHRDRGAVLAPRGDCSGRGSGVPLGSDPAVYHLLADGRRDHRGARDRSPACQGEVCRLAGARRNLR